jgi:hypothetical protein
MLVFKKYFVDKIKADATMQGYLAHAGDYNVYPGGVDLAPEQFPAVTFFEAGSTMLSRPQGMRVGMLQVDIWSINTALEVENIYTRLAQLFNFQDSTTNTFSNGKLYWLREQSVKDMSEPGRRLWRKMVNLKYWASNTDFL